MGLGTGKPISSSSAVGQGQYTFFDGLSTSASLFHREICGAGDPGDFHKKCLGYIVAVATSRQIFRFVLGVGQGYDWYVKKHDAKGFQLELREKRTTLALVVYEMYDKDID